MLDDIKLPPPEDVDPLGFHDRKGRGITYVPMRMALYVQAWLRILVHTEGIYYRYQDGFWQPYSEHDIKSIITRAMGQTCQGNWVGAPLTLLAAANVSAKKWPVHPSHKLPKRDAGSPGRVQAHPSCPSSGSRPR